MTSAIFRLPWACPCLCPAPCECGSIIKIIINGGCGCYNTRFSRCGRGGLCPRVFRSVAGRCTMSVPLTVLSEDEELFRDSCRSFAEERIKPLVRKMDEEAKLEKSIIPELFSLGLMGIHIPEEFGGA